jgi:hypothetical protein
VNLRLCKYGGSTALDLPIGIVVHLDYTIKTCPSGFSDFADANGRFLVFASATKNMTDNNLISPAAPVLGSLDPVGLHSHLIPDAMLVPPNKISIRIPQGVNQQSTGAAVPTGAFRIYAKSALASRASFGLPYVQLRSCKVTAASSTLDIPPTDMIFFYDGQTCPGNWVEATARTDGPSSPRFVTLPGRIIFSLYNALLTAGQTNDDGGAESLTCAWQSCGNIGHAPHIHTLYGPNAVLYSATAGSTGGTDGTIVDFLGGYNPRKTD